MKYTEFGLPLREVIIILREALYKLNGVGCCLHITLDDGNIDNGAVQFCLEQAKSSGHGLCQDLAELILSVDETTRGNWKMDMVI